MRSFLKNTQSAILQLDSSGIITSANQAASRLFGYSKGELEDSPLRLLLPDNENAECLFGAVEELRQNLEESNTIELVGLQKDGVEFSVEVILTPFEKGYFCSLRDVSGRQLAEALDALLHTTLRRVLRGQTHDQFSLFLCEKIVELLGSPLVWIGLKKKDGSVCVCAKAGKEAEGFPLKPIKWNDVTEDFGPTGEAIRSRRVVSVELEKEKLKTDSIRQIIVFPLVSHDGVEGVLEIHSSLGRLNKATLQRIETFSLRIAMALQIAKDQHSLRLQREALEISPNAFIITNKTGEVLWINDAFCSLSGYAKDEILNFPIPFLKTDLQNDSFYEEMWTALRAGESWQGEIVERHKTGALYTVEQRITPILDSNKELSYCVIARNDVTQQKQAEGQVLHLANYDQLTGLPNRRLFQEQLNLTLERAEARKKKVALAFADLTNFNRINDTLGHSFGDKLLKVVAQRLSKKASPKDFIARIGGDEFTLIVEDVRNAKVAAMKARSMIETILAPIIIEGVEVNVGACVGISIFPDDGVDSDKLVNFADMALRKASDSAPNSYFFFSQEMNEETEDRIALERDLRKALIQNEFELYFQPQLDVRTGKIHAVEALVRWFHPVRGMISPMKFIPIAEDTGLIIPLGDWILEEALKKLKYWDSLGLPQIAIAVNLSAIQFQQEDLAGNVKKTLKDSGLAPERLELELTESVVMQDARRAGDILSDLSSLGIKLAIDDFGTGYSSLSYLKKFAVDRLKIDQSFVRDMTRNYDDAEIAHAIINLGHTLGLEIVSEGVETKDQLELLKSQGCDIIQGYYIAKPMSSNDFIAFMQEEKEF